MFSTIHYGDREYPARIVMIPGYGERAVSILALQKELIDEGGSPVSPEAEAVDNGVFFYVDDYDIMLGDRELAGLVMEGVADRGGKVLTAYLHLDHGIIRKWNDLMWSNGHLDFRALGIEPNSNVARWSVKFEDGFSADMRIISGSVDTLRPQAVLFDAEGSRVSCTGDDESCTDDGVGHYLDGEWILWDGSNSYHVYVMKGDDDEQKEA